MKRIFTKYNRISLIEKNQQYCAGKMFAAFISLFQKLIDVQQTLIAKSKSIEKNISIIIGANNPGKTKKI